MEKDKSPSSTPRLDPRFLASTGEKETRNNAKLSPTALQRVSPSNDGVPPPASASNTAFDDGSEKDNDNSEDDDPDSNNSSSDDEDKKHDGKGMNNGDAECDSSSNSSGLGNIKPKAAVAPDSLPNSPTANEKPVERIQFSAKDFYHGHANNDCFLVWKQYKQEPQNPNKDEEMDKLEKEKKLQRMERRKVVANRRKIKDRTITTVRQKKEKPPKVVRIRRTRQIVQRKVVKKQKSPNLKVV
jgi:hypothetical protein